MSEIFFVYHYMIYAASCRSFSIICSCVFSFHLLCSLPTIVLLHFFKSFNFLKYYWILLANVLELVSFSLFHNHITQLEKKKNQMASHTFFLLWSLQSSHRIMQLPRKRNETVWLCLSTFSIDITISHFRNKIYSHS